MKFQFSFRWLAALVFLFGTTAAFATAPLHPVSFEAGSNAGRTASFSWHKNDSGSVPTGFHLYASNDSGATYTQLETFQYNQNTQVYTYTRTNMTPGVYRFGVKAYNGDGTSEFSNLVWVTIQDTTTTVHFTTLPSQNGTAAIAHVNTLYEYNAHAEASNGGTVMYVKISGPDAMTVNSTTGAVRWTPGTSQAGMTFAVVLKAVLANNTTIYAQQSYSIAVVGNDSVNVHFTSSPNLTGHVGSLYEYNAVAVASNGSAVNYLKQVGPDAMTVGSTNGFVRWTPTQAGTYSVAVKALLPNTTVYSIQTYTLVVTGNDSNSVVVHFTNEPPAQTLVNVAYSFQSHAVASNGSAVNYVLISAPQGMTINSSTGTISWTPTISGTFGGAIRAYIATNSTINATQQFSIHVNNCAYPANLVGTVKDGNGNNVPAFTLSLYQQANGAVTLLSNYTFTGGSYFIPVYNSGTYLIHVTADNYTAMWYTSATEMAQAARLTIACNDTVISNFVLTRTTWTVGGHISARNGGAAIYPGKAVFYGSLLDTTQNKPRLVTVDANTNQSGNYVVNLPRGYSWILYAYSTTDNPNTPHYLPQYYDGVSDPADATSFTLDADRTDLNVTLPDRPNYNNSISGYMRDSVGNRAVGHVVAYLVATVYGKEHLYQARSVETDTVGNFIISNLIPGSYVLSGRPSADRLIAGYYRVNNFAVFNWAEGTQVTALDSGATTGIIIKLQNRNGRHGLAHLNGNCSHGITLKKVDGSPLAPQAISGVTIYAIDSYGQASDYTFSNTLGMFSINDLAKGTYTIIGDKVGYEKFIQTLEVLNEAAPLSMDVVVKPTSTTGVTDGIPAYSGAVIYPNPVSGVFTVIFDGMDGIANISIVNALGMTVSQSEMTIVNGRNELKLDASTLSSGAYFAQIRNNSNILTVPMSIVK